MVSVLFDPLVTSIDIRLGPSASQVGSAEDSKVSEMLKAITVIQQAMKEPWAQKLMGGLNGFFDDPDPKEVKDAKAGLPSASVPTRVPVPPAAAPSESAKPAEVPPKKDDVEVPPQKVDPKPPSAEHPPDQPITSSSHRAAHARLTRKMAGLSEAECPNMAKLWAGSRKDWC